MLPNNSTEGNPQAPAGAAEQPTSPTSGAESQPLPEYVTALQSQIADLTKLVSGVQKGTDKQIGQVRGDIKRILELGGKGLDETQIQRELYLDQLMNSQSAPVPQAAGPAKQDTGLDVETTVQKLQFAPNDPALAALRVKFQGKPADFLAAAAELRINQLQTPSPTAATGLSQTGNPTNGMSEDQATEKLLMLEDLYKNFTLNKPRIEALENELEAAGVIKKRR